MSVPIYQFCRGFDNVRYSEVYKCHVSGGYAFEKIARASYDVPEPIRQAVIDDYFKLNDNYPPDQDDFALIAREIDDKYSVLAVANRQLDDGGRPTIGYKYFWLEKSSSDIDDGIGTLVYWWLNQNKPKFNMDELDKQLSPSPKIFHVHELYKKLTFEEAQLQDIKRIVVQENKIPHTTVVTKELWRQRYPEYTKLHYVALGLSFRSNNLNSWAWNVHKIAYPERFLAIFYATKEDIPKNISSQPLSSQQRNNNNATTATTQNPGQIVPKIEIRNCLKEIAIRFSNTHELDLKKTEELFEYLANYPNETWANFIDETNSKESSDNFTKVYKAEIYLLSPKEKSSFMIEILNSINLSNSSRKSSNNTLAIEFQTQLLKASFDYKNELVSKRLVYSIYTGISYLLNQLISTDNGNNKIEFLLTQSQSVWYEYFLSYAELIERRILCEKEAPLEESMETFCQEISNILQKPQDISLIERKKYKKLGSIFTEIEWYNLAGTFYYISDRHIPKNILDLIDDEIYRKIQNIQLSSQDKSNSNNEPKNSEAIDNKSENNRSQKKQNLLVKPAIPKRPKRRGEINNRIWFILFGIFLASFFIGAFVTVINNPPQPPQPPIQKNEKHNNSPISNLENPSTNSATPSASNISSGCATDVLSDLEVFKGCNKTDKDNLELQLRNNYKLFSTEIGEEIREYYLSSKDENQFQDRKFKIQKCQNDNPIKDDANGRDNLNNCIKDITQKSPQPKR
ncbi:MAG: hypothetical protein HEQ13_24080 [Dolichospermum sp. DEX189]|nr:hypothetical protein [Dolichospermum sp. DEX189]